MDLSKLPRFSRTPQPPDNADPGLSPSAGSACQQVGPLISAVAEAWISISIGAIVLLMQQRFLCFVLGKDTGWTFQDERGNPLTYTQSLFFINDLGLAMLGLALVLDGILFLVARAWAVWIGLVLTVIASLLNLFTFALAYPSMGPQWFPAVGFAIGAYTAFYQWKLLRLLRAQSPAPLSYASTMGRR